MTRKRISYRVRTELLPHLSSDGRETSHMCAIGPGKERAVAAGDIKGSPAVRSPPQDESKMSRTLFALGLLFLVGCATAALVGGFEDAEVDDEDVLTAAHQASRQLSKQFAGKYHHKLAKVVRAKKQVVAGMNYKIDLIVGKTSCDKKEVDYEEVEDCPFTDGLSTYKKCTVVVYRDLKGVHRMVSSGCILANKKDLE